MDPNSADGGPANGTPHQQHPDQPRPPQQHHRPMLTFSVLSTPGVQGQGQSQGQPAATGLPPLVPAGVPAPAPVLGPAHQALHHHYHLLLLPPGPIIDPALTRLSASAAQHFIPLQLKAGFGSGEPARLVPIDVLNEAIAAPAPAHVAGGGGGGGVHGGVGGMEVARTSVDVEDVGR